MPLPTSPAGVFPIYLLPSVPFRRKSNKYFDATLPSLQDTVSTSSQASSPTGYLSGSTSYLRCTRCLAHLCPTSSIISKGFQGRHGRAYLVRPPSHSLGTMTPPAESGIAPRHHQAGNLPNTHIHKPTPRMLVTGAHTVSDISCVRCGTVLGWKYVDAEEEGQKYKVGMFILETQRVNRSVDWENGDFEMAIENTHVPSKANDGRKDSGVSFVDDDQEDAEFDSEDEDECEDLFMGIWSPALAKKRRRAKAWKDERDIV
ncbi:uncharacterized protein PV09_03399 [Verruconis gallopava]|uniref:Yippee domain-containing protein n=1 Tax=Verruconis gallopava TaxID=253628 RepID=A0A0D1YXY1_9PEZI|nr:uncharacterized protein PV09_03399 [Verruconis gallopava]KIW05517.1 hypothetical protein PV09_03399 [Verruconis gallopava]